VRSARATPLFFFFAFPRPGQFLSIESRFKDKSVNALCKINLEISKNYFKFVECENEIYIYFYFRGSHGKSFR
jgi:hypothetical protein